MTRPQLARRTLVVGIAVASALLLASGTMGASSTGVERSASVSVVGDEDGFVGVAEAGGPLVVGETGPALTLRNGLGEPIAIEEATVADPAVTVRRVVDSGRVVYDGDRAVASLASGRRATVEVACTAPRDRRPVEVAVDGDGAVGFQVRATASVACVSPTTATKTAPSETDQSSPSESGD